MEIAPENVFSLELSDAQSDGIVADSDPAGIVTSTANKVTKPVPKGSTAALPVAPTTAPAGKGVATTTNATIASNTTTITGTNSTATAQTTSLTSTNQTLPLVINCNNVSSDLMTTVSNRKKL